MFKEYRVSPKHDARVGAIVKRLLAPRKALPKPSEKVYRRSSLVAYFAAHEDFIKMRWYNRKLLFGSRKIKVLFRFSFTPRLVRDDDPDKVVPEGNNDLEKFLSGLPIFLASEGARSEKNKFDIKKFLKENRKAFRKFLQELAKPNLGWENETHGYSKFFDFSEWQKDWSHIRDATHFLIGAAERALGSKAVENDISVVETSEKLNSTEEGQLEPLREVRQMRERARLLMHDVRHGKW